MVDEAGMVNEELRDFVDVARGALNAKVLYVGDPAQLPPIGEEDSSCWYVTEEKSERAMLKQVMRFDNQLLRLATHLRDCVKTDSEPVLENDNEGEEGVFVVNEKKFWRTLLPEGIQPKDFLETKVAAWRNKTVDVYNKRIRAAFGFEDPYCVGDVLLVASPVDVGGTIVATVDEELTVETVTDTTVSLLGYEIPVHQLLVRTDANTILKLNVPTEDDILLQTLLSDLAAKAKRAKKFGRQIAWKRFWEAKNCFHTVRYGYSLTVHRLQGSTYKRMFVDAEDILSNSDKNTAYRCLYVAATRSTTSTTIKR